MHFLSVETFLLNTIITGTAAAFAKTLIAPIDRTKVILQNQDSSLHVLTQKRRRYKNAFDVFTRIPNEQVQALFKISKSKLYFCFRDGCPFGEEI